MTSQHNAVFSRPPRPPHRSVVLAGSAWALRAQWQPYAAQLAAETVLVVLPEAEDRVRPVLELVAAYLAASGRPVHMLQTTRRGAETGIQGRFAW
jgi:hypothetical protein